MITEWRLPWSSRSMSVRIVTWSTRLADATTPVLLVDLQVGPVVEAAHLLERLTTASGSMFSNR